MGYPDFVLEPAQAFRTLLYCMTYVFGGAALIGVLVYIFLLGSEILFSKPRSRAKRVEGAQSARNVGMAEVNLSPTEPAILSTEPRDNERVRRPAFPVGQEMPNNPTYISR